MTRIASIFLPRLAIERWTRTSGAAPDAAVALVVEAAHGQTIHAVTDAAAARGARPGMRLTDARALDPALQAEPANPAGDAAFLAQLARWASRWSPLVEVDPSTALGAGGGDGLRLDATGVAHLFGGEDGLAADIERCLAGIGLTARVATAATAGAAWGLARFQPLSRVREREGPAAQWWEGEGPFRTPLTPLAYGESPSPLEGEGLSELLAPLPVEALRLDERSVQILHRLGLKRIGDLAAIPRKSLARRFREADNPLDALDRALGMKPEPLTAAPIETPPRALLRLAEPVVHPEAGAQALDRLIPNLARQLETRRLGARRLHLTGYRVDGSIAGAGVATAIPSRDPAHLHRLLKDKAASLDPGFGFDAFVLVANWSELLAAAQESLVEEPSGESEVARLVDRLSVKLGAERVRRPVALESHWPERASGWVSAVCSSSPRVRGEVAGRRPDGGVFVAPKNPSTACGGPPPPEIRGRMFVPRPHHLLDSPEAIAVIYATPEGLPRRFVWRAQVHDIARAEGPERIAPEWWRERSSARLRDYYRVEDASGRRYWIYREGVIGDGRGGAPAWFLHGMFW